MKTAIIAVGSVKEKYYKEACDAYLKRLAPISPLEIIEIKEEYIPDERDDASIRKALMSEGQGIISRLTPGDMVAAMTPEGDSLDSREFAFFIDQAGADYRESRRLVFIIGGSHGLSPEVYAACHRKISFGPMTFPRQLARLMLIEQIYRARMIISNRTYHK